MFFERGAYDPAAVSEAKTKLAQFQGATSISSNQYFGREDEDEEGMGSPGSFTGNESLSALESATRDALSRVMAKEEVQNAIESVRAGALKVCGYFYAFNDTPKRLLNSCECICSSQTTWHIFNNTWAPLALHVNLLVLFMSSS